MLQIFKKLRFQFFGLPLIVNHGAGLIVQVKAADIHIGGTDGNDSVISAAHTDKRRPD